MTLKSHSKLTADFALIVSREVIRRTGFTQGHCFSFCLELLKESDCLLESTVDEVASKVVNRLNMGEHFLWNFIELSEEEYARQRKEAQVPRLTAGGKELKVPDNSGTAASRLSSKKWI